ncbi:MAG TPA: hypothetical protein PKA28_05500 [Methylomusa anaerophila]|uniref:Uncharacterized protein n=1 Tax=Methylomusa anaerophila TaxID=1930071 RepID=A0A348AM01_9FIRM|nr:hypothetical protein [Methylomusa anaerophila]BBB92099.1 hypothetical protein MAMMFC1_02784 [Methylomusa anaerophila]HML87887.1 hypothetical protein [Methylomusa anaerophila]
MADDFKRNNYPQVYFSEADKQMEGFSSFKNFVFSLIYGILFSGDQIIPDIYFYISSRLSNIINRSPIDGTENILLPYAKIQIPKDKLEAFNLHNFTNLK